MSDLPGLWYELAMHRVYSDNFLYRHRHILVEYEWDNQEKHLEWVATAPDAEIFNWIAAVVAAGGPDAFSEG